MKSDVSQAIKIFQQKKEDCLKRFMSRQKVSIAMMLEKDDFIEKCDWAINILDQKE